MVFFKKPAIYHHLSTIFSIIRPNFAFPGCISESTLLKCTGTGRHRNVQMCKKRKHRYELLMKRSHRVFPRIGNMDCALPHDQWHPGLRPPPVSVRE